MTNFSGKIKNIRKQLGLSQEEFGNMFHVSRQAVSNWESNQSIPDIDTLSLICTTLNISSDELLFSEADQMQNKREGSFDLGMQLMLKRRFILGIILIIFVFLSAFWLWLDIRVGSHFICSFSMRLQESPFKLVLLIFSLILMLVGLLVSYNTLKNLLTNNE